MVGVGGGENHLLKVPPKRKCILFCGGWRVKGVCGGAERCQTNDASVVLRRSPGYCSHTGFTQMAPNLFANSRCFRLGSRHSPFEQMPELIMSSQKKISVRSMRSSSSVLRFSLEIEVSALCARGRRTNTESQRHVSPTQAQVPGFTFTFIFSPVFQIRYGT